MSHSLRVVVADDERPARSFLAGMLRSFDDVELVGEATNGSEAVEIIEERRPDLALLDLQMPELDGLGVVKAIRKDRLPLVAFVTAFEEYAIRAFELHAVDYLLKPVERKRLRETINRAYERLERSELLQNEASQLHAAVNDCEVRLPYLERVPIKRRDETIILAVREIASVVAEGELLHVTTVKNERHTFSYRLKDLESRLDPAKFVRLGRGALANIEMIRRITPQPGGTYVVTLTNDQQLNVSRLQGRILREQLLRL